MQRVLALAPRAVLAWLGRARTALWLLLLVALAVAVGSFLPQAPGDPASMAAWQARAAESMGPLARLLAALGLTRYYRSAWLWVPVAVLAASLLVCAAARWRRAWRSARLYAHVAPLLVLAGLLVDCSAGWQRTLSLDAGGAAAQLGAANGTTRSAPAPAVAVAVAAWRPVAAPQGSSPGYEADLQVMHGPGAECRGAVRLGHPLDCLGTQYTLLSLSPASSGSGAASVQVLAGHHPGFVIVIGGFLLLVAAAVSGLGRPAEWRARP
jgi:hypothetical protein